MRTLRIKDEFKNGKDPKKEAGPKMKTIKKLKATQNMMYANITGNVFIVHADALCLGVWFASFFVFRFLNILFTEEDKSYSR